MTGMAKPTVVSKDKFIGTVPQHFRLDSHAQRGADLRLCGIGGIRGGMPAGAFGFGRWTSTQFTKHVCLCASFNYNCSRNAESETRKEHVIPIRPKR